MNFNINTEQLSYIMEYISNPSKIVEIKPDNILNKPYNTINIESDKDYLRWQHNIMDNPYISFFMPKDDIAYISTYKGYNYKLNCDGVNPRYIGVLMGACRPAKVFFDSKQVIKWAMRQNIFVRNCFDASLAIKILFAGAGKEFNISDISSILGLFGAQFNAEPSFYSEYLKLLKQPLTDALNKCNLKKVYDLEQRLTYCIGEMENNGLPIDHKKRMYFTYDQCNGYGSIIPYNNQNVVHYNSTNNIESIDNKELFLCYGSYKDIDIKIAAAYSKEPLLLTDAAKKDPYGVIASEVLNKPLDNINSNDRDIAKDAFDCIIKENDPNLHANTGMDIQAAIKKLEVKMPVFYGWSKSLNSIFNQYGAAVTKRHRASIGHCNTYSFIKLTANDIIKDAISSIHEDIVSFREQNLKSHLLMAGFINEAIILEVNQDSSNIAIDLLNRELVRTWHKHILGVPVSTIVSINEI